MRIIERLRRKVDTRTPALALALAALALAVAAPGAAAPARQLPGRIGSILKKAQDVRNDLVVTDEQEQEIGAAVSERVRRRYGVVQDPAIHRYVALVGTLLAQASSRPNVPYRFIVLDTDGVNAFAAPGGYVHITRGTLALVANEAELAAVLAHELIHVTEKHTIGAIKKGRLVQVGANETPTRGTPLFAKLVDACTDAVMAGFGRAEELESDQKGARLANAVGYAPSGMPDFLARLVERNKESSSKQGLFASHPEMQERIERLRKQIQSERLASTIVLEPRYHAAVSYPPIAQAHIAVIEEGAAGMAGDGKTPDDKAGKSKDDAPPPKKKGFGLGGLLAPGPADKRSSEVTASAAARGMDKERNAKGGPVIAIVVVNITPADLASFRKDGGLRQ
jgi:Zn-dependent protease with chaperone function